MGEPGEGPLQFRAPSAIAISPDGFLYIADTGNQRIQKINPAGKFIAEVGGFGWEREQFDRPVSVSATNGLDVFVADHNNHRIERYDKDLHYLGSFTSKSDRSDDLQFAYPLDVALSTHGELYVLHEENQRVLKMDIYGNPQFSFGDYRSGEGRLAMPNRMCILPSGRILVSDIEFKKIFVYDLYGNFLFSFGEGILQAPAGMFGMADRFWGVADPHQKSVIFLDTKGEMVTALGEAGQTPDLFAEPVDAAVYKDRLYVLDREKACIEIFQWRLAETNSNL